jgi:hypothetical protein
MHTSPLAVRAKRGIREARVFRHAIVQGFSRFDPALFGLRFARRALGENAVFANTLARVAHIRASFVRAVLAGALLVHLIVAVVVDLVVALLIVGPALLAALAPAAEVAAFVAYTRRDTTAFVSRRQLSLGLTVFGSRG